jgi:hypothetical protein
MDVRACHCAVTFRKFLYLGRKKDETFAELIHLYEVHLFQLFHLIMNGNSFVNSVYLLAYETETSTQTWVALLKIFIKFTYRMSKLSYCKTKKVEFKENIILP